MMFWWSALLIIGNLTYFVVHDLRLSLVALASCVLRGFWGQHDVGTGQTDRRALSARRRPSEALFRRPSACVWKCRSASCKTK